MKKAKKNLKNIQKIVIIQRRVKQNKEKTMKIIDKWEIVTKTFTKTKNTKSKIMQIK